MVMEATKIIEKHIVIKKLELILEVLIMLGDDPDKVLSYLRKELNEIINFMKSE